MQSDLRYIADVNQYGRHLAMGQVERQMILTPALCRAARGFLDWTQSELAAHSGVSRSTIRDYEGYRHEAHRATEAQLRLALERGGVTFIGMEDGNLGLFGEPPRPLPV
ncbi:helix-turn-helix transcriptional regulator [Rhizobium sp. KVB221]|uniref:Helix-turn-helix transcriptional regulator n=1 Tax=Rhizobium setariae TaxID=2801340 RepID=A0A936YSE3_9HYPH|nr:helix-turn-helix transcriptional regulator [Rhizobium setariae]MBL0373399.1 helix-turn-helix transcriptional regulator [Rhizobium setariae]